MVAIAPKRAKPTAFRPVLRRFNVDEYYRMVKAGILHEDDHVELLEGTIIQMAPMGNRHAACVNDLAERLIARLAGRAITTNQTPLRLSSVSEPEPDLMLLKFRSDRYRGALPGPADVLLLVEVSDTTLRFDRTVKLPLYAAAGIPEVWIVDLSRKRVLVHQMPEDGGYRQVTTVPRIGTIAPAAFPELELRVADLLG